jgi:hypothetical protein
MSVEQIQEASSKYLRQVADNRYGRSGLEMEMDDAGHTRLCSYPTSRRARLQVLRLLFTPKTFCRRLRPSGFVDKPWDL